VYNEALDVEPDDCAPRRDRAGGGK